jgi:hypothetical protein
MGGTGGAGLSALMGPQWVSARIKRGLRRPHTASHPLSDPSLCVEVDKARDGHKGHSNDFKILCTLSKNC